MKSFFQDKVSGSKYLAKSPFARLVSYNHLLVLNTNNSECNQAHLEAKTKHPIMILTTDIPAAVGISVPESLPYAVTPYHHVM